MNDPIEKNQAISSGYENESLGMSIDPALVNSEANTSIDPEAQVCSLETHAPTTQDNYTDPQSLKELDLDTPIPVNANKFKSASLSFREVLEKAGEGNLEAISLLTNVLEERLQLQLDKLNLAQSFNASENNIVAILTQLKYGDEVAKQQAAKSLVAIIEKELQEALGEDVSDETAVKLLKGLIVAAGIMESDEFAQEFAKAYHKIPEFKVLYNKQNAPKVPNWHKYQKAIAKNKFLQTEPAKDKPLIRHGGGPAIAKKSESSSAAKSLSTGISGEVLHSRTALASIIDQALFQNIQGTHETEKFLTGTSSNGLGNRLLKFTELAHGGELTPQQLHQSIRLAVLSSGTILHSEFNTPEKDFTGLQRAASRIAEDVLRKLDVKDNQASDFDHRGNRTREPLPPLRYAQDSLVESEGPRDRQATQAATRDLGFSLGVFSGENPVATTGTSAIPLQTQAAAALQGAPLYALAKAYANQSSDFSRGRPSWFVEGPTPEAGANSDGGGGSSRQGQQGQSNSTFA